MAALVGLWPAAGALAQERARLAGGAAPDTPVAFEVFVPPGPNAELDALLADQTRPGSPHYHHFLGAAEYRARFGTDPARLDAVAAALRGFGFAVAGGRAHVLRVAGTAGQVARAFAAPLADGVFAAGRHGLVATAALRLPAALARVDALVAGFSAVVRMRRHSRVAGRASPDGREGAAGPYWFTDLRQAYDMPDARQLNGNGVTIGVLMAGNYNRPDMVRYFHHEKLGVPFIAVEPVFGGARYSPVGSIETHLDLQQAGGLAPRAHLILYNIPDLSDAAVLAGLTTIVEENAVDIVSMSFGAPEIVYTAAYNGGTDFTALPKALDVLFRQGNAEGITFVASSGDAGALAAVPAACLSVDASPDCGFYGLSVEHPASSPYVTAVGGTNLLTRADAADPADLDASYRRENAYDDRLAYDAYYGTPAQGVVWGSGGGISLFEPKPAWQALAPTGSRTFRAVPDLAGHMGGCIDATIQPCPPDRSGDMVAIDRQFYDVAGTSAAAPDFAAILAMKAQHLRTRLGNVNAEIYALGKAQRGGAAPPVFHDVIPGNNGFYPATPGYNLVLGNGTVRGRAFIGVMHMKPAGVPLSPTNP